MDDTTQSRASDAAAAAATKKRRSSILKNQRSVRTPFSELEFNVATPTDTAKSRRVSFSRRTGVAEFATNEATTTWKNFYEEHNKSLESSGNDSGNSSKQIGHIGKRLFDQQFEEVDIGSLNPGFNNSFISNVNFAQMTVVENTADIQLSNSQRNFEISNMTCTQSKVFGDEYSMPQMCENSQPIDINFSAIDQIEGDDLDEIQKDLQNNQNLINHGPFGRHNVSEYIEVDLNCTSVALQNVESDMSITDTIHSPKVQEVSKSVSIEKLPSKDWVTDKENIAINPYITPKESTNFAVNEEPEKVLVFDGKRLTLQPDVPEAIVKCPEPKNVQPQRKTIVLNVNDDLPNFIDDPQSSTLGYICVADLKQNTEFDSDMSITKPLSKSEQSQSQKTVVFDNTGDISFTQAIISNIVQEKRRTIVYERETGNISMTQAVPTNIIEKTDKSSTKTILYENEAGNLTITQSVPTEKRKTIVYENEEANISMTEAIPLNIIEKRAIVVADDLGNLSITQAIPNVIIKKSPEKNKTIIYDDVVGRLSVAQSGSLKLTNSETKIERRQTVVFEDETGNISVTEVVPANINLPPNSKQNSNISVTQSLPTNMAKRRTIVFDDADISMTQAVPNKILSDINTKAKFEKRATIVFDNENADMSVTQAVDRNMLPAFKMNEPIGKRRTVFDNVDVSITEAIDRKILSAFEDENAEVSEKRRTVFEDVEISITQAVNSNVLSAFKGENAVPIEKRRTVFDNADISVTQAINTKILPAFNPDDAVPTEKRRTVFDDVDISITQAINSEILPALKFQNAEPTEKRRTVFDNADISMTQAINADILAALNPENDDPIEKRRKVDDVDISATQAAFNNMPTVFKDENAVAIEQRRTVFDNAEISMTQAVNGDKRPALTTENAALIEKRRTVFNDVDISITQAVHINVLSAFKDENAVPIEKRRTVFDNADVSMTQAINADILPALNPENDDPIQKRRNVDDVNISITQAVNSKVLTAFKDENAVPIEKRRTVLDNADISVTQAIHTEILTALNPDNAAAKEKRQTVFDDVDISITQAINSKMLPASMSQNAKPTEKRRTGFDNTDISMIQAVKSEPLPALNTNNGDLTEKRHTVFDNADVSITQAINRDILPAFNKENDEPMTEEKQLTVFDNGDISINQTVHNNQIIELPRDDLNTLENNQDTSIIIEDINEKISIIKEDVNERRPISEDVDMTEVPPTKSIAFEDRISLVYDTPSSKPENEGLDVVMTDMNTKSIVDSTPITSNISNNQIKYKQPTNEILVYQIASSGLIQKDTKENHTISQQSVDPSSMDVDDEERALTTKTSNDINSDDLYLKTKDDHEINNDGDRKLSGTSNDEISTKSSSNENNSKSDIVSDKFEAKSSSNLSKFSSETDKDTVTLVKEKHDAQSLTVLQLSHGISDKNLSGPKLTSRPPSTVVIKTKDSLLKDLLDMSKSSFYNIEEPKSNEELCKSFKISTETHDVEISEGQPRSSDTLFFITKEDMKDDQIDAPTISDNVSDDSSKKNLFLSLEDHEIQKKKQLYKKPHLSLEYKEENPVTEELQQKLALLQTVYLDSHLAEKPKEANISHRDEDENLMLKDMNLSKCSKKFKLANDTKELLDMLSDLTEKESPQKGTLDPHLEEEEEEKPEPVIVKGHIALENKVETEETEPRRRSFLPQRRSIVFSREDLLNNISMATAALQKSRAELEESLDESSISESPEQSVSKRRTVRMSDEIVKTLNFDDSSNQTMNSDTNMTPLKKTAFGETTYMTDHKCKVIPSYLKDVSSDIKELMDDLVKPMADTLPFEAAVPYKNTKKLSSTCSVKLQANLITSSQVDLTTEPVSTPESPVNVYKDSSINIIEDAVQRSLSRALKSPIRSVTISSPESSKETDIKDVDPPRVHDMSDQKAVLVFDQNNPLNNVLLAPLGVGDVHRYNPIPIHKYGSVQSECASERSSSVHPISSAPDPSSELIQMNVSNQSSNYRNAMRKCHEKTESESKPASVDQSVDTMTCQAVKDKDVNTDIAMKKNKELLETNSSLTLVDGPSYRGPHWSHLDDIDKALRTDSYVQLLYKDSHPEKLLDSDMTSNDSSEREITKKRAYSPALKGSHKHCSLSSLDLTPKPLSKMQKISETPPEFNQNSKAGKDEDKGLRKKSPKKRDTIMVQQVTAEYDMHNRSPSIKKSISSKTDSTPRTKSSSELQSLDIENSFTSSNNLREDRSVVTSAGWQDPEPDIPNYISDSDSQSNIVAKLNMLSFMGSHECEWESSTSELWSFLLLHSCVRLTVKLQHSHKRAGTSCIRADTPVQDVHLEVMHKERKNPVAVLGVRFAAEAMRYELSFGCRVADDVSSLLKRCARVARLATRWARAMQDMKMRLAYSLTTDGLLALTVANIPLRSVWEIHFKMDMTLNAGGAPFPQASAPTVVRVVADKQLQARELRQVLRDVPLDWGHAPRSIWRVFKYLKYKRDYDVLGMER